MQVKRSQMRFVFQRKSYTADVQEIKGAYATPMIRVVVPADKKSPERIFIFWRTGANKLFSYHQGPKEKPIADAMVKAMLSKKK